ncbi:MAG: AAA family ATPase [Thermodesulfobacteriota bacterium]|nr:AAA family ATPase [Thermodesulfobacteriota bacterium]
MFFRNIINELRIWADEKDRKPLILRGARQVGKTTAVEIFSDDFDQYIYLNLEKNEDSEIFNHGLPVEDLIQSIYLSKNITPSQGKTLVFIDEIQNSPQAIAQLRYFYESAKKLHIIAAGSLLEVMIGEPGPAFPVGRVQYMYLYPLTFEEFLAASGEDQALKCYHTIPFPDFAFTRLLKLFHRYTLIGGMPEIVGKYIENKDIAAIAPVYQGLLVAYLDDVSKYARNTTMAQVIRHAIESAPLEAGQRIKFQGFGNSNYKSREMGEALRMLERAMLIYLLYPSTVTQPPVRPDLKKSPRLQFLDTGLINYFAGLQDYYFKMENLHSFYKGLLAEHIVGQELLALDMKTSRKPSFWIREKKQSNAEVDFIIPFKQHIIPVEVKSGKTGALRSLHQFMIRADHPFAVRLYAGSAEKTQTSTPDGKSYTLLNLPYFLAGKLYDYIDWLIKD